MLHCARSYKALVTHILLGVFCCVFAFAKANAQSNPCAILIDPMQGETDVSITTNITFATVPGAVSYFVDLGTTAGGTDILNNFNVNASASFTPPQGLPELTVVFITIRAFFISGFTTCDTQFFTTEDNTLIPLCTQVDNPINGSVGVPVETDLFWDYAPRAIRYLVTMGTTSGGNDVFDMEDVGNVLFYDIPFDLNPLTTYYVTITPENENGAALGCNEIFFETEFLDTAPPACTQLIAPADGAIEVSTIRPILEWSPVANADGYFISVGSSPMGLDVIDMTDIGNVTSTPIEDFDEGITYYVTITPYNDAGEATGCMETSFTTTFGCGPYIDDLTGEVVDLNPVISLEEIYERCAEDPPLELSYSEPAFSVSWYRMGESDEVVFSTNSNVTIEEPGIYRLEVTNEEVIEAGIILCTSASSFEVVVSQAPIIESISFVNQGLTAAVTVTVSGNGDYEYASNLNGPYQTSPTLSNLDFSNISVYVRDRNGCGTAEKTIRPDLGFPRYFTPNNDGINDTWQVRGAVVNGEKITQIEIFDRFGRLIVRITPEGPGWDGTLSGRRMIDQGFWYKASTVGSQVFTGQFVLKR